MAAAASQAWGGVGSAAAGQPDAQQQQPRPQANEAGGQGGGQQQKRWQQRLWTQRRRWQPRGDAAGERQTAEGAPEGPRPEQPGRYRQPRRKKAGSGPPTDPLVPTLMHYTHTCAAVVDLMRQHEGQFSVRELTVAFRRMGKLHAAVYHQAPPPDMSPEQSGALLLPSLLVGLIRCCCCCWRWLLAEERGMLPLPLLLLLLLHGCRPSQAPKTSSRCLAALTFAGNGNRDNCAALFEMAVPHFASMDSQVGAGPLGAALLGGCCLSTARVQPKAAGVLALAGLPAWIRRRVLGWRSALQVLLLNCVARRMPSSAHPRSDSRPFWPPWFASLCTSAGRPAPPTYFTAHLLCTCPSVHCSLSGAGHCCVDVRALPLAAQPGAAGGVGGGGVDSPQPDQLD